MTVTDRLRLAVFIDFDNIEIGVKQTLNASFDAGLVLEALKERGDVVSKTAYSDWQRAGGHSRMLTQHAITRDDRRAHAAAPTNQMWRPQHAMTPLSRNLAQKDDNEYQPSFTEITIDVRPEETAGAASNFRRF